MKDLLNSVTIKRVISSVSGAASNAAQVGQAVDGRGYESVTYAINTGDLADADATFTVLVEDSPDNSVWTAVADNFLISQSSAAPEAGASFDFSHDNQVRTIGYRGIVRYTRLTITPASNAGAWLIGAVCILGHRRALPFTQPTA